MHYLYIIFSKKANKYYVGETSDFKVRLEQHNSHEFKGSYTTRASDWDLKLIIEFQTIQHARAAENFIKRMRSWKFIERLIADNQWLKEKFSI